METGVVAIRGTNVGVALGKVLTGMYVGLNENRKRPIVEIKPDIQQIITNLNLQGDSAMVDPLYTLTLAGELASEIP